MEAYIGQITIFAGNFPPKGWAFCQGQVMQIRQYTALFSLLGTTYGGDGKVTFALPDLRGRMAIQQGSGPGLTPRTLGEMGGSASVTLISSQMPAHTHSINCNKTSGSTGNPSNNFPGVAADAGSGSEYTIYGTVPNANFNPTMAGQQGGSQPHENMQPYLAMNFIICIDGIFPARN